MPDHPGSFTVALELVRDGQVKSIDRADDFFAKYFPIKLRGAKSLDEQVSGSFYWQSAESFTDLGAIETTCSAFVMPSPPPGGGPYTCLASGGQRPQQNGYALVNFRFDWNNFLGQPFDASIFVDNAFDKTYQVGANALLHLTGTSASIYAPPRMWGVELRYRFGADGETSE